MRTPLYTKYRPHTFEDVSEQKEVIDILQNQLNTNTIRNCYLFVGPSGVGKTTLARIFANVINKGASGLTEMDAASNNGVEDVRLIIEKSNYQALDAEYRIFLLDECFHRDTLISTPSGDKKISELVVGDYVDNMCGIGRIKNIFKNSVSNDRLCIVTINGKKTLTTVDELYFTEEGWVEAQYLKNGERVYSKEYLHKLWKSVLLVNREKMLLKGVCKDKDGRKTSNSVEKELCDLWKGVRNIKEFFNSDLFEGMRKFIANTEYNKSIEDGTFKKDGRFLGKDVKENDREQSYVETRCCEENDFNQENEGDILFQSERWKWLLYKTSVNSLERVEPELRIRVSNTNRNEDRVGISYLLQSRPRVERDKTSDRGGWCFPQIERSISSGYKKDGIFEEYRVDSVEIYKQGSNDKLFRGYLTDKEYREGITELYDLEIEGHNSFIANNTLVHNCHMFSTGAWNAMLKTLEEPPKKTIFMFCTTDPQKIPDTIINRVQRFDLTKISYEGIVNRLNYIVEEEKKKDNELSVSSDVIEYIAKLANGGMRDAVSMLDKCLGLTNRLELEQAVKTLGSINYETMFDLFFAMYNCDEKKVIEIVDGVYNAGRDLKLFIKQYTNFLADICKYKLFESFDYVRVPKVYIDQMERCKNSDNEVLKTLLDKVNELNSKIKYESQVLPVIETELLLLSRE